MEGENNGAEAVEDKEPNVEEEKEDMVEGEIIKGGVVWEGGMEKGELGCLVVWLVGSLGSRVEVGHNWGVKGGVNGGDAKLG